MSEGRDRDLVRLYWPAELRPAFDALLDLDDAMAAVVARDTEPAMAAIKLAWWRERLEEIDEGQVPAEPRLRRVAAELLPRGVRGVDLAELTDGWATLLDQEPEVERVAAGGAKLFAIAARLLGAADPLTEPAGRLYGRVNAARRGLTAPASPSDDLKQLSARRVPKRLRPLTALAALAARDLRHPSRLEPETTPGRSWALIRHRMTGRI